MIRSRAEPVTEVTDAESGKVVGWTAQLRVAIVDKPGQLP